MSGLRSDRRLALTADRSRAVEATDPEARYLLVEEGGTIPQEEVDRLGLSLSSGKIVQGGGSGFGEPPNAARRAAGEESWRPAAPSPTAKKSRARKRGKGKA